MAAIDKLGPGDPIRSVHHQAWNNAMSAGEAWADNQFSQSTAGRIRARSTDIIKVKNNSGSARSRGEVLGNFGKSLTTLTAEKLWLTGAAPVEGKAFGVLLKALPSGDIGEIQLSGVCLATVNISDTDHRFAEISGGSHTLVSAETGPVQLVYAPASTGNQECVIRFGMVPVTETQRVITAIQVTGETLQYKYRDIQVVPDDDESAWTTFHTGESECP